MNATAFALLLAPQLLAPSAAPPTLTVTVQPSSQAVAAHNLQAVTGSWRLAKVLDTTDGVWHHAEAGHGPQRVVYYSSFVGGRFYLALGGRLTLTPDLARFELQLGMSTLWAEGEPGRPLVGTLGTVTY